jgi:hypothetical protein
VEHPKDIGDISMLAVTLVLRTLGYGLYLPYGENTRCDLMLERDGFVDRVQCKTGRLRDERGYASTRRRTTSSTGSGSRPTTRSAASL